MGAKELKVSDWGYMGKILRVDLSNKKTSDLATADYSGRFIGGRGVAAKIYWDAVQSPIKALDPENFLILMTGPLTGFPGLASSRLQICGRSPAPAPESFSYANLGGGWGPRLKYAGYDGLGLYGKSDSPVYLFVHDGTAEIREAP